MNNTKAVFTLKRTKSDQITCEVFNNHQSMLLHSAYNPVKEAQRFIALHLEDMRNKKKVIVYGIGCGYHVAELLRHVPLLKTQVEVWEFNVDFYRFIEKETVIQTLLQDTRVSFRVSDQKLHIKALWDSFDPIHDYLLLHPTSLKIIPENLHEIQEALEIFQTNTGNMQLASSKQLKEHFQANLEQAKLDSTGLFNGLMDSVPMVLVAAGPSLAKSFALLKKYREKVFIGCVGTALVPLFKEGIYPDFFILTDPLESLKNQFSQLDKSVQQRIPLFYLGSVASGVVSLYAGPKIMLLQSALAEAKYVAEALQMTTVQTGGSVATTLLDWMVCLGAKQICFVGQDLAYTNYETHIGGTAYYARLAETRLRSLLEIDDFFLTGKVYTPRNLYIYKKWIETYVWQHRDISFFNATQGGAHIQGCQHVTFEEFISCIAFQGNIKTYKIKFMEAVKVITESTNVFNK